MIDTVTKGMVSWERHDDDVWNNYTQWQASLMAPFIGQKVLEVGPGMGRFASYFNTNRAFVRYVAVEPSNSLFKGLSERCPNIEAYNRFVEDLGPEFDNQFDTILMIHVLEHIEHDQEWLLSLRRFLSPGGQIIVMVPAFTFLFSELDKNVGHYRRYDRARMKRIGTHSGYQVLVNRYDNFIGIFGWLWFCKIRKVHYQEKKSKSQLMSIFGIFDKYVLPVFSAIEKKFPPPAGLNLTTILRKSN